MNTLSIIGQQDLSKEYVDRPTVKVIINNNNKVLVINSGLLPGGGVDPGESNRDAVVRELHEELGVTVKGMQAIGTVVQYRNLLGKKYIIYGYSATLDTVGDLTNPQDEGETQFASRWLNIKEAIVYVSKSIEEAKLKPMNDDTYQGKLYNLMTTHELLKALK